MKIGIFGGTFDPPHIAHLAIAAAAAEQLELDEVLWIPASANPLKTRRLISSPKLRLEMVKLATKDQPLYSVSDIEITRGGPSYAIDTLQELIQIRPAEYWLILGSDSVKEFTSWRQPEKLLKLCRLAVAIRPSTDEDELRRTMSKEMVERTDFINIPLSAISSTEIRDSIAQGQNPSRWVPNDVWQFIMKNELYRDKK